MTVTDHETAVRAVLDDVCAACYSSDMRVFVAKDALDALVGLLQQAEQEAKRWKADSFDESQRADRAEARVAVLEEAPPEETEDDSR